MKLHHSDITEAVIGAVIEALRDLGPGLLESAFQRYLARELSNRNRKFETEIALPVEYERMRLETGYRLNDLVEDAVIVEIKSVDAIEAVDEAQLLTYLRLSGKKVGLLINYHVPVLKEGIARRVL